MPTDDSTPGERDDPADPEADLRPDDPAADLRPDDPAADLRPDDPAADLRPDDPAADLRPDDPSERFLSDDPETSLGPGIPSVSSGSPEDVDPELRKQFWTQVVLFNVALFGMSLGVMLVGFEGRWRVGGAMFAVGAVAFVRGWLGYRAVRKD